MGQDETWDVDAATRYDTPGTGMFAPEVLGPTVDRLAELAGNGRALELAIGTGRVAIPLSERGVRVTGIELSTAMMGRPAAATVCLTVARALAGIDGSISSPSMSRSSMPW